MRCNDIVRILVKNNVDPDVADNKGSSSSLLDRCVDLRRAMSMEPTVLPAAAFHCCTDGFCNGLTLKETLN
jgi:hypothetical protein